MSYERKVKEYKPMADRPVKETVQDIETYPILAIPERGISQETCELLGIRSGLSETDGETVVAHYFPYYSAKGQLSGYKKRDLTLEKSERGHFTTIGTVGVACKMFGQQYAETVQRKHKTLHMVEGEYDVAAAYDAMILSVKGGKYEDLRPFIVGLSCGTANAVEAVLNNEEWVRSFEEVCLGFDGDSATAAEARKGIKKGMEAREDVAAALMTDGLFVIEYGEYKDPCDFTTAGKHAELAKLLSFGKTPHSIEQVIGVADIDFEDFIALRPEGIYVNEFPRLMKKIHGFRIRELVLVTAPSGVGKSTATSIIANALVAANEKIGMIYLEEQNKETLQRLVAADLKVNYLKFKNNPLGCASREAIKASYDKFKDKDQVAFVKHFGSMPIKSLMNKIKYMHFVKKCKFIVLDHISVVISGSEVENERKELDIVMTELAAFCAGHDVGIIVVCHINRSNASQFLPPKNHPEDESFWVRVTKESLRGSASLEQLSFVILGLEPEIKPDRTRGNVRWTVLKNRPWGYLGEADEFSMDDDTWEVLLANPETEGGF